MDCTRNEEVSMKVVYTTPCHRFSIGQESLNQLLDGKNVGRKLWNRIKKTAKILDDVDPAGKLLIDSRRQIWSEIMKEKCPFVEQGEQVTIDQAINQANETFVEDAKPKERVHA